MIGMEMDEWRCGSIDAIRVRPCCIFMRYLNDQQYQFGSGLTCPPAHAIVLSGEPPKHSNPSMMRERQ